MGLRLVKILLECQTCFDEEWVTIQSTGRVKVGEMWTVPLACRDCDEQAPREILKIKDVGPAI